MEYRSFRAIQMQPQEYQLKLPWWPQGSRKTRARECESMRPQMPKESRKTRARENESMRPLRQELVGEL